MSPSLSYPPKPLSPVTLEPGLRLLLCPNPSPMTFHGTNTYLLGTGDIAVIDPGPQDDAHLKAILASLTPDQKITHIIVTHSHLDHSPLASVLSSRTGAPIFAFGPATAGRSLVMQKIAAAGLSEGGEGIDHTFTPDICVQDGYVIEGSDWNLEVLHTPGHLGNHICLAWGNACFTADHVMGWASSLVSPPDGDLTDFMSSCDRLAARNWRVFYPGHGAPVDAPNERLTWLIEHRRAREVNILDTLSRAPATAGTLAQLIYTETPSALMPAATRNVFAHLIDLYGKTQVSAPLPLTRDSVFSRVV